MSEASTETNTDAEIAAALGVGQDEDIEQDVDSDEGSEDQESEDNDELAELKREVAKLRREAAARRIAERKQSSKVAAGTEESTDVEAARAAGREEARAEHGIELTEARIRAALTGIVPDSDLDEFVEDLNIARYVSDDHKPDLDAISALKDRQAKLLGGQRKARVSNGRRGSSSTAKSNADEFADIAAMLLG